MTLAEHIAPPGRRIRLHTLVGLRWIAIAGQVTAVLVARTVFDLNPNLWLCGGVIGLSILANIAAGALYPPNHRLDDAETAWMLVFDILQLFALLFLTGGLNNPFALLMIAPVTIAATTLKFRSIVAIAALSIFLVSMLRLWSLPIYSGDGRVLELPDLALNGFWIAIVVGTVFLSGFAARVTRETEDLARALTAAEMALAREQKLTDLGGIVAATAHELGTPLATIKMASAELCDDLSDRPDLLEDARLIGAQADRCRDILRSMGRAGKDDAHLRRAPLVAVVREAAEPHMGRGKRVVISIPDKDQPVVPRSPGIVHGLRNLIQNAVDFAQAEVVIEARWNDDRISLSVADDGPGFPAQSLRRLGDPFFRLRSTRREGYEGMGLGLFIAKTLLERSGAMLVFSNAGGALVTVRWHRHELEARRIEPVRKPLGKNVNF